MVRGRAGRPGDAVLVTGSSGGIGLETALHLAGQGFRVFATVRSPESRAAVEQAASERGVTLDVVDLDLTDPSSIEAAVATVVERCGGIFGLVNNGGIGLRGAVEDSSPEEVRRVFETNVLGTVAVTQTVLPHMRAAGCGRIVTITSIGGRVPGFGVSIYCSSKFAQEGFAEGLSLELAPFGIQSIIVAPGMLRSPRWEEHRGTTEAAADPGSPYYAHFWASESMADRIVERSPTTQADVAEAIEAAFLDEEPQLRYIVGRGARIVVFLRRHLPPRLFERLYYGGQLRRIERHIAPELLPTAREEALR